LTLRVARTLIQVKRRQNFSAGMSSLHVDAFAVDFSSLHRSAQASYLQSTRGENLQIS
jgi:hypothetical protein